MKQVPITSPSLNEIKLGINIFLQKIEALTLLTSKLLSFFYSNVLNTFSFRLTIMSSHRLMETLPLSLTLSHSVTFVTRSSWGINVYVTEGHTTSTNIWRHMGGRHQLTKIFIKEPFGSTCQHKHQQPRTPPPSSPFLLHYQPRPVLVWPCYDTS